MPETGRPVFSTTEFLGTRVRAVRVGRAVSVAGQSVQATVIVAQTREGLDAISSRITLLAAGIGVGFFLLAVALCIFAADAALRPLTRLAQTVAARGPSDLRPIAAYAPAETAPLLAALNALLGRLRATVSRSEDFIAEAAHRIRTPLATVRTQAEIALRRVEKPENKVALRKMIRAVDESSRSAGQLLDHALVAFRADTPVRTVFDLGELVRDETGRIAPVAELRDIAIACRANRLYYPVQGDRVLLQNALRNILDNAIKYSDEDGTIDVVLDAEPGQYRVTVTDQGRGFPDDDVTALTARFSRGTNVASVVGSGLGLTITDEVARAHGGRVELAHNVEGRGACVSLVLPSS